MAGSIILSPISLTLAPIPPYCVSADVARILRVSTNHAADFDANTTPTKEDVDKFILLVSSHIDMTFREIGYKVPLEILPNESWPAHQTEYLCMLCILGTASMISSKAIHPAANARIRNLDNMTYTLSYDSEIKAIQNSLIFQADYYLGTQAEKRLSEPYGPDVYSALEEMNTFFLTEVDAKYIDHLEREP